MELKQFIPDDFCLSCLGCCRFAERDSLWAPVKYSRKLKELEGGYSCPELDTSAASKPLPSGSGRVTPSSINPEQTPGISPGCVEGVNSVKNLCGVYKSRPLDCRIYPFLLIKRANSLYLGLHKACRFIEENDPGKDKIAQYARYLKEELNALRSADIDAIVLDYKGDIELLCELGIDVSGEPSIFKLKKLKLKDKGIFKSYLKGASREISAYNFANIFIWNSLFKVWQGEIDNCLCIFYEDHSGIFMALPPLGDVRERVIDKCFEFMALRNKNTHVGRIENVAEEDLHLYQEGKYKAYLKDKEYVYLREKLVALSGNSFRHKRAGYNQFANRYKYDILRYSPDMYSSCLKLYRLWADTRLVKFKDDVHRQMLKDSYSSFRNTLKDYRALNLSGYVVKVGGHIKGCTFGYALDSRTFCVLFETCDLSLKGIAQFISREFCRKLSIRQSRTAGLAQDFTLRAKVRGAQQGFQYINFMGASDLKNLEKVKLSYRPAKEIKVYNIYRDV